MTRFTLFFMFAASFLATAFSQELPPHALRRIGSQHIDDPLRGVYLVVFSPDGKLLATRGRDQIVRIWGVESGDEKFAIDAHEDRVTSMTFMLGGKLLVTTSPGSDEAVRLWDTATGEKRHELEHGGMIVHSHPDGQTLLVIDSGRIVYFDCEKLVQKRAVPLIPTPSMTPLLLTPNCESIVWSKSQSGVNAKFEVFLHNIATGTRQSLTQFEKTPVAASFSPDGRQLIVSCRREEGIHVFTFGAKVDYGVKPAHDGQTQSIAYSRDGRLLATASWDKTIRLWDVLTGEVVCTLTGHTEHVCAVSFSADGSRMASGASGVTDNSTLLWDVRKILFGDVKQTDKLTDEQLSTIWQKFGADSSEAYQAMGELVRAPVESFAFLKSRVAELVPKSDPATIDRLIIELDSDEFQVREAAQRQLSDLRVIAEARLKKALEESDSFEVRSRIKQILAQKKSERELTEPERRRIHRMIHALELIGTGESKQQLVAIASGFPNSEIIAAARSSADRFLSKEESSNEEN